MREHNIKMLEGQSYKICLKVSEEQSLTGYNIYGNCQKIGKCHSLEQFTVGDITENEAMVIIPSLEHGSYHYQLFIQRDNNKQEFLVCNGRIEVANRISNCNYENLSENRSEVNILWNEETLEVTLNIEAGLQGDKGDKGDKGDQGFSAYEVAKHHGYEGTEELWVKDFEGAQDAAAEAKSSAEAAASSEAMAEYYYKGSQTNYNNTITEAINAEQYSNNAKSSAAQAQTYSNTANSAAAAAEEQAMNAESHSVNASNSATQAETYSNNAKSSAEEAKNYSEESGNYYTQSANSATYAYQYYTQSANSAAAAAQSATSAATNASKLGDAALKNSNNTFSGTNTFNNVTKLTVAPNSLTSVMNEEASMLLDFVQQAGIRTMDSTLTKVTGSGAQAEYPTYIRYTVPKNNTVSVWKGSMYPFSIGSYFNWSAVWVPFYTSISQKNSYTGPKSHFIASLSTYIRGATEEGDIGIKIIKQTSDITKPFLNFNNIKTVLHCAVLEIYCEIVDKKLQWTLYAPVFGGTSGKVEEVKVIKFQTAAGSYNYTSDSGFLLVYSGNYKAKIFFRDFYTGSYRWIFCGEIDMRSEMFSGSDFQNILIYAGSGGDMDFYMYVPKQITFLPKWVSGGNFANCQQILQAVTPSDRTETIITIDDYNALQA